MSRPWALQREPQIKKRGIRERDTDWINMKMMDSGENSKMADRSPDGVTRDHDRADRGEDRTPGHHILGRVGGALLAPLWVLGSRFSVLGSRFSVLGSPGEDQSEPLVRGCRSAPVKAYHCEPQSPGAFPRPPSPHPPLFALLSQNSAYLLTNPPSGAWGQGASREGAWVGGGGTSAG